jgi:hypothetical protein
VLRRSRAPLARVAGQVRGEEHARDLDAELLELPGGLDGQRRAGRVAPQQDPGEPARGDLVDDAVDHLGDRRERLVRGGHVVAGQLDRVDGEPAAP